MDIIRLKHNNNFKYFNKRTKKSIDNSTLKRIKTLKIPPAYKNVHIHVDPYFKHQATGYDSLNRKQYIYHPDYKEEATEIKFEDLIHFGRKIKRIRKDLNNLINSYNYNEVPSKDIVISIVILLIDKCNFRVGSDKYRKLYNSYGVTTLNRNHIEFKKNYAKISFNGKKGVYNSFFQFI